MNSISQGVFPCIHVSWSEIGIRFPGHMLDSQGQQFSSDIGWGKSHILIRNRDKVPRTHAGLLRTAVEF